MKILYANNFFGPFGGAEAVMWDEANLFAQAGYDVHFFATDRKPYFIPDYPNARFFPKHDDLRSASALKKITALPKVFYNRQAEHCLESYLQYLKPDLVHIHNLHYHLSPSILAACKKQAVPVVMTLHDIRLICPSARLTNDPNFKGLCNTGNPLVCLRSRCKNGSLSETTASIAEHYMNRSQVMCDGIEYFITPSAALLELMVQSGFPRTKFIHINNFVDETFLKTPSEPYSDEGYFLYVGRLSPEKGVHYLLQAMAQLPGVRLKIAGTGPQETELKLLAAKLNLSNVEFLGFQTKESVTRLLRHCRASVLPCNWFENLPLSVLESLACAKPVIASNVGGLPEMLDYGRCGILVPPTDVQALARSLEDLGQNPGKAVNLGLAGLAHIHAHYTPEHHFKQLSLIYERVVSATNVSVKTDERTKKSPVQV